MVPQKGDGWERLHDALLANRGLQAIVDVAAELLGNPCYVGDSRFKVLAMTCIPDIDDLVWRAMQEHGYASLEQMRELDDAGVSERVVLGRGPQRVEFASSSHPWVNVAIGDDLAHVAYFGCMELNKQLDDDGLELFSYASRVIACELRGARYEGDSLRSAREHFLFEAVTGEIVTPEQFHDRMARARLKDDPPFRVLVVRDPGEHPHISDAVRFQLENVSHASCSAIVQDDLALLLSGARVDAFARTRSKRLAEALSEAGLVCGASPVFVEIGDLSRRCREAKVTADLDEGLDLGIPFLEFDDPYVYPFSAVMAGHFSLESFVHPYLVVLEDYDRRKGTQFVETLETYMRNNYNVAQTARDLFTHRNTIDYRLRRIEELIGSPLTDPNVNMALWLSLQTRRLMSRRPGSANASRTR